MTEERRNAPEFTEIEIELPEVEEQTIVCADCERTIKKGELYVDFDHSGPCCAACFLEVMRWNLDPNSPEAKGGAKKPAIHFWRDKDGRVYFSDEQRDRGGDFTEEEQDGLEFKT